jgi:aminoglycoside phosphotransferase
MVNVIPVVLGELDRLVHAAQQALGHPPVAPADEAHAHAPLVQLVAAAHQQRLVEAHEVADLVGRALPVLGGEGVDGEPLDAEVERALDRVEQRLLAGGVALGALQPAFAGPPAVAVHDDGDVVGTARGSMSGTSTCARYRPAPAPPLTLGAADRTPRLPTP